MTFTGTLKDNIINGLNIGVLEVILFSYYNNIKLDMFDIIFLPTFWGFISMVLIYGIPYCIPTLDDIRKSFSSLFSKEIIDISKFLLFFIVSVICGTYVCVKYNIEF